MPTNSPQVPSLSLAAGLGGFVAAVAAAAVVGIVLAVSLITGPAGGHHAEPASDGPFSVAEDVRTSFGYLAVEHAETVKGLTSKDLAGAVHGIGDFVGVERALVKASVTLRNGPKDTLPYSLRQFTLVATKDGKERRHPVVNASVRDGLLQPDAVVDASLGLVVPRDGAELALEFTDPGRDEPIVIDLKAGAGRATAADKRSAGHGH
jgi:hypothetical protein